MASITKRGNQWLVRWRDPDGSERGRTCPDAETARKLSREIERTVALGHRWDPADGAALPAVAEVEVIDGNPTITGGLVADYLADRRRVFADETVRAYERSLGLFVTHLRSLYPTKRRLTVDLLARDVIGSFYDVLIAGGLSKATARLRVTAVYGMWDWAFDSDVYGDAVPRPRRIDLPAPVFEIVRAPTWAEMDATILAAYELGVRSKRHPEIGPEWRGQLLTVLRFTGLRVGQAMELRWDDLDLDAATLRLRGELGKSRQEKAGRIMPISRHLVAELAGWGVREGYVIAPGKTYRQSAGTLLSDAWAAAEVPESVWKKHTQHAFRKGFTSGLKRLGADSEVVEYLVGHSTAGARAHYLDPSALPLREVVDLIPPRTTLRVARLPRSVLA